MLYQYKQSFMMVVALSLTIALAACGGSEQRGSEQPTQATVEQQGAELVDANGNVTYRPHL